MAHRNRRPILVSRNELDLAIRAGRQVKLTYRDGTGAARTETVLPLSVQSSDVGDYLMVQRGRSRSAVALEDIDAFDLL